ncbi:hypothetical protein [Horticoccus sp. 23ND18S-11]|uniref:hypothetical protein n=1 Tax=Horticoccus sp. 23ND18S-11 TaxID=3391832 RepID=UPI0039C9DEAD
MMKSFFRRGVCTAAVVALTASALPGAETTSTRSSSSTVPASAANRNSTARPGSPRALLPDPALLDGSSQPPEKKSEHGMIGDFELPGDENARSGKVGGPQGQPPGGAGGGQQNQMPMGLPQGGGGAQGQQAQQGGQQGGAPSAPAGAQQAGGAQAGGPQNPNAAGAPVAGAGDPGGQPQGTQVGELGGDAAGQPAGGPAGGPGEKPGQVAIGDKAMRIDPSAGAQAGVVGAQQQVAGQTQQHEKGTGSGGKGSGGAGSGNRVEKGRVIPAGL